MKRFDYVRKLQREIRGRLGGIPNLLAINAGLETYDPVDGCRSYTVLSCGGGGGSSRNWASKEDTTA